MSHLKSALIALAVTLAAAPSIASARTLHWSLLDVEAHLDAEGRLRITERHTMVFSGAWNGGERSFNLRPGQRLSLVGIARVNPATGEARRLRSGDLSFVDNYAWHDRQTLRWRSRLPSDPEFDETAITYVIEYELTGVLWRREESYRLDHDFAFTDRVGDIERFRLEFDLDPVWETPAGFSGSFERGPIPPGLGVVVTADLRFRGDQPPAEVLSFMPDSKRLAPLGLGVLLAAFVAARFVRHERKQGRFLPADAPEEIDRQWLEEVVFSLQPEVAGALWDGSVGAPEVSALIARWVHEGRVASRVRESGSFWKKDVLELELLADRSEFIGYEKRLLSKLFFGGRSSTDTEAIKKRYRSTGFSPASSIRAPIERKLRSLPGMGRAIAGPDRTPGCLLMLTLPVLLGLEYWQGRESALVLGASLILGGVIPIVAGFILAHSYRRKADGMSGAAFWLAVPLLLLLAVLVVLLLAPGRSGLFAAMRLGWPGLAAVAVFFVLVTHGVLNAARTRESTARVAKRKQLAKARALFAAQLGNAAADLEDDWLPYLLAFGLDRRVDRWFRSFGGDSSRRDTTLPTTSGSSGGGWTGGGGAFGGAGATAAWTAAAGGIAAGVSAPSSSGGGGGSSGGGSSGGGGGGGW